MTIRKIEPQPSAPRPVAKPSTPVVVKPPVTAPPATQLSAAVAAKTGRTSSFETFRPAPVELERHAAHCRDHDADSTGRGTNDDSIGRGHGTNDDSIGRGTNDDSIGRGHGTNDDSIGRGTNDDSIGKGGPSAAGGVDGGVGKPDEPTDTGPALKPGRAGLSTKTTQEMDALLTGRSQVADQAAYVFKTPEFAKMSATERAQIVTLMSSKNVRVARGVAEMFEQSGGAMLTAKGKDGSTVLDSLNRLAASPNGEGVLGQVVYDLVNPGRIRQGRAPTCTVTTMQYELAHEEPGEYARLMAGLVCDGKVTMRGGGELVSDSKWDVYASDAAKDGRSTSEAIFQAAAMEFANGSDTYLEYAQESVGSGQTYRGLHGDQITAMVGQLFGVKYETKEIGSDAEATAELNEIMARERPNRPVLFDITIDGQQSNHCVSLEAVRNGRVYFRDPTTGERESMTVEEFRHNLAAVHYAPPSTGFLGSMVGRFKDLFHF